MDADLLEACELTWSPARMVTSAEGLCERVLGRPASGLIGAPLHEALQTAEATAAALDSRVRHEGRTAEFLPFPSGGEPRVLRLSCAVREDAVVAAIQNANAFLAGAPPLQISRLSSSLSHEIRNPLSSVKMAVQTLARNQGLSERDQRRLTIANREIRTMERMLGLLSEYGRDSSPHLEPCTLHGLAQDALSLVEPELKERGTQVELEEPAELPKVTIDALRLRLVLAQLFLNVAMGLPEGAPLRITLRPGPQSGAQLAVRDPSASVPEEERATLFEPFGSRLARGAGLSLAALRRVLQLQGGEVTAQSLAEAGALFTLTFPG